MLRRFLVKIVNFLDNDALTEKITWQIIKGISFCFGAILIFTIIDVICASIYGFKVKW